MEKNSTTKNSKLELYNEEGQPVTVEFSTVKEAEMFQEILEREEFMYKVYEYEMEAVAYELEKAFEAIAKHEEEMNALLHIIEEHENEIDGLLDRLDELKKTPSK